MMIEDCGCEACAEARRIGELVSYTLCLEEAILHIRRLIDDGNYKLALELVRAAAREAEARDLRGEISRAARAETIKAAKQVRREGRLH